MFKIKKNRKGGIKQELKQVKMCSLHPDKKAWARGLCKNCYNKWLRENDPEFAERQRENCRRWTEKHKERIKQYKKDYRLKQDKNYGKIKRLREHGLTLDDYELLLKKQKGVCAICGKKPSKNKRFAIDHDHDTGLIRGLLCFRCNFGLSYFSEDYEQLRKATLYLKNAHKRGVQWGKELAKRIDNRDGKEKVKTKNINNILKKARTCHIQSEEKAEIKKLCKEGKKLAELCKIFPQYSRSSICRAMKEKNNAKE